MQESKYLALLHGLAKLLERGRHDGATLEKALALIAPALGISRCAISAVNPVDGRIRISAAYGLAPEEIRRGEYLPGEGITGSVVEKGRPVYIDDISTEPLFLNRTRSRKPGFGHIAFSCVPIVYCGDVIGSFWLDQDGDEARDPDACLRILRIIAAMLAPVVRESDVVRRMDTPNLKFGRFVGNSPTMQQIYAQIMQVAPSRLTVFLGGESGTGKELAARAIHEGSPRAAGPFISVNCAAIPESLVESELFGHERGAFTGASQTRKGKFELAHHGTLFLDEIGETSPAVQARLLRVLQDRTFERIGGSATIQTDVRIIAATNRNLAEMVKEGSFRLDLYYRLNVFSILMPALRDRIEDIPALAAHFLQREAALAGHKSPEISAAALAILQQYAWPGNIRELENVIERSSLLGMAGGLILPEHLPENLIAGNQEALLEPKTLNLKADLEKYEKRAILTALTRSAGHIGNAAKSLGMTERVLALRLARYDIDYKDFREKGVRRQ